MVNLAKPSYLFYDIETTGLNKCFDQILQFAAIRTDLELNELERHEIRLKLNLDVIPSPEAIITHRISINDMLHGISEVEAIQKIHTLLNTPGTISVGYNTLGFDDEFLRFSFYRNLLPPYTHQFSNNCSRMDIYPIAIMYYLFNHEALIWPCIEDKPSFKLEQLNQANQLATGQAHDAIVDVEVTIALARRFLQHRSMWDYVTGYFHKSTDLERMSQLPFSCKIDHKQFQEGLLVSASLGAQSIYQAPVISLGQHQHYRNQTLWLRLDDIQLTKTTEDTIAECTHVMRKRPAEQPLVLPPKDRFLKHFSAERKKLTDENRLWLQENPHLVKKICDYHQHYKYPVIPNLDCEAALYEVGFPSPFEEKLYQQFHQAKPEHKEKVALRFSDAYRQQCAMRLLARHHPDYLSAENCHFYQDYCQQIFSEKNVPINYRGEAHLTPQQALQRIKALNEKMLDEQQQTLLTELESYLVSLPSPLLHRG